MKFHIVSIGESLSKIAFLYQLEEEEIKKENKHVRVWNQLVAGTKLKIPTISETVEQDIAMMEPFIEDYYPKLKLDALHQQTETVQEAYVETKKEVVSEEKKETEPLEVIKSSAPQEIKTFAASLPQQAANPEYRPPQYYYPNYMYYQYPRATYPAYYYPVYYYPSNK